MAVGQVQTGPKERQSAPAEMEGRKCYAIEIDPIYCDVIVKRWEEFTGKKAKRLSNGRKKQRRKTAAQTNGQAT